MQKFRAFLKNNKGATAIEYGLIAALIAVAAIGAMGALGNQLRTTFSTTTTKMGDGVAAATKTS
jgi:pilus assembly protein Flp/PilA